MSRPEPPYTRYPRPILWLLREGRVGDVRIDAFYLSKSPVSNRHFEAFEPSFRRSTVSGGDDDPATGIDYDRAIGYCNWYARVSRKRIRLPTEAEWEYACRGGTTGPAFFGDPVREAEPYVWDAENSGGRLPPLSSRKTNPFGLLGMLGCVWEWTASPGGGPGSLRGGSFRTPRVQLRCDLHRAWEPGENADDIGFRIARSLGRASRS